MQITVHPNSNGKFNTLLQKRIKIITFCSWFIVFTALFFLAFDSITGSISTERFLIMSLEVLIFGFVIYNQKSQRLKMAKWLFMLSILCVLLIHCNYSFRGFYGEYQYLAIPLLGIILFDSKPVHWLFLILSISAFYVPNLILKIYPDIYFGYLNASFIFVGVFLTVSFFRKINDKNEAQLYEQNRELREKNALILEQKQLIEDAFKQSEIHKRNELALLQLKSIKAQMNPHFIFNSLNSIQDLILREDTYGSYDSIVVFSQLVRQTLIYSEQEFIPIEDEIKFLDVYLKLEKLRHGDALHYTISYEQTVELMLPPLLLQPFVENALIHGLLHKKGDKRLSIDFSFSDKLICKITDNGIGRDKAKNIKARQKKHHKSFAMNAIKQRLNILKEQHGEHFGYTVSDLPNGAGTSVTINLPYKRMD